MGVQRLCDNCLDLYVADERNLKRGWGLCCSKSCAAEKREKSKPGYNPQRVAENNIRRENWNGQVKDSNHYGDYKGKHTSEGYKIYGTTAVDQYGEAVYEVSGNGYDDPGDDEYWNDKDF